MGKRRQDADSRRFFDEFMCVKIPRLRATGVVHARRAERHRQVRRQGQADRLGAHQVQAWRIVELFPLPAMRAPLQQALAQLMTGRAAANAARPWASATARNMASAGLSVCEPPISISTRSSPSSKPTSRWLQPAPASWQGKARGGLPQPSPDPVYAPPHDHAQA